MLASVHEQYVTADSRKIFRDWGSMCLQNWDFKYFPWSQEGRENKFPFRKYEQEVWHEMKSENRSI